LSTTAEARFMPKKERTKKTTKSSTRRKVAAKKSKKKMSRRSPKKPVKKSPVAIPVQPIQPIVEESPIDERQEEIHDAEDAIVDEREEEDLGEAV
jgi:hypothetical protein